MPSTLEPLEVLKKVFLFSELAQIDGALEKISSIMEHISYSKGQEITKQGHPGNDFFVLIQGQLGVHKDTIDGDDYKVAILDGKNYPAFGEGGLIDGEVRTATILCLTPVECLVLNKKKFDDLCVQAPHIGLPIFKKISQSLIKRLNQTSNDLMLLHKALMDEIRSQ